MSKAEKMKNIAEQYADEGRCDKAVKYYLKGIKALDESPNEQKNLAADFILFLISHIREPELSVKGWQVVNYIRSVDSEFSIVKDKLRDGRGTYIGLSQYLSELRLKLGIPDRKRNMEDIVRLMISYTFSENPRFYMFFYYFGEYMYKYKGNLRLWRGQTSPDPNFEDILNRYYAGESHNTVLRDLSPYLEIFSQPRAFTTAYEIMKANEKNTEASFYWLIASALEPSASVIIAERYIACEEGKGICIKRFYEMFKNASFFEPPQKPEVEDCLRMWMRLAFQKEEAEKSRYASYRLTEIEYNKNVIERLVQEDYPEAVIHMGKRLIHGPLGDFFDYCTHGELDRHPDVKDKMQKLVEQAERLELPIAPAWRSEFRRLISKNSFGYESRKSNYLNTSFNKPDPVQIQMDQYKKELESRERFFGALIDGAPLSLEERELYAVATNDVDLMIGSRMLSDAKNDYLNRKRAELEEEQRKLSSYDIDYSDNSAKEDPKEEKKETLADIRHKLPYYKVDMTGYEKWFMLKAPSCVTQENPLLSSPLTVGELLVNDFDNWIAKQGGDGK